MTTLTYGTLPKFGDFVEHFNRHVGPGEWWTSEMKGEDRAELRDADMLVYFDEGMDAERLHYVIGLLTDMWTDSDNDWAGGLASNILTTIGYEWV